jgi:hypothetical protein
MTALEHPFTALEDGLGAIERRIGTVEERFAIQEERISAMIAAALVIAPDGQQNSVTLSAQCGSEPREQDALLETRVALDRFFGRRLAGSDYWP